MAKALSRFTVSRNGDDYLLQIESEDGETLELSATYEQLDVVSEALEEQLDADEQDALAFEDADEEAEEERS